MNSIKTILEAVKSLFDLALKDFKIFAFIVSVGLNAWLLWFCFSLINDNKVEQGKTHISTDIQVEKLRLACDVEIKLLRVKVDTLEKTILSERSEHNKIILDMKNEQKEIYERILKWRK